MGTPTHLYIYGSVRDDENLYDILLIYLFIKVSSIIFFFYTINK